MNSRLFLTSRVTVDVLHPIIAAISRKLLWNARCFSITHLLVKLRCWNFIVPLFRHFGHLDYTTFRAELIATLFRFFGRLCKGYCNIFHRFFAFIFAFDLAYLSKRIDDFSAYPQCVNLAILIPQKNIASKDLYWKYANQISLTKPVCFADFINSSDSRASLQYTTLINKTYGEHIQGIVSVLGHDVKYTDTMFAKFDEYLHQLKKEEFRR